MMAHTPFTQTQETPIQMESYNGSLSQAEAELDHPERLVALSLGRSSKASVRFLPLVLSVWLVAVSSFWADVGRFRRVNSISAPRSTRQFPVRSMVLAMNPRVLSTQSQIDAVGVRIDAVQAQITDVAESIKAVQRQVVDVGADMNTTEGALNVPDLSSEKQAILVMKLKSLMKKEENLMDEKKILMKKEEILMKKEESLMDEKKILMNNDVRGGGYSIPDSFFQSLKSGTLNPAGQILRFDDQAWDTRLYPREVYVRQCWKDMYDVMGSNLSRGCRRFVVTGVPGIGKSQFLLYFMWRLAQKNEPFLLEETKRVVICYAPGQMTRYDGYPENIPSDLPYLCDMAEKKLPYLGKRWVPSFTAVFSSPNPDRFQELLKRDDSVELVMPPWDADEIFAAHSLLERYQGISLDVVKSQFAVYGGVPRHVLEKASQGLGPMTEALSKKGASTARRHFRGEETSVDSDVSHMLTRIDPADDTTFIGREYCVASTYVMGRLCDVHQSIMLDELRNVVNMKQDSGGIFEYLAARYGLANDDHKMHRLTLPTTIPSQNAPPPSLPAQARTLSFGPYERLPMEWRDGSWTPRPGTLYYQNVNNLKSVDAFMIDDWKELFLFQMTVGVAHPVKAIGLKDIYELFSKRSPTLVTSATLVFVTPADSALVTAQPLLSSKNKVYKRNDDIAESIKHMQTEQFVIRLNMDELTIHAKKKRGPLNELTSPDDTLTLREGFEGSSE